MNKRRRKKYSYEREKIYKNNTWDYFRYLRIKLKLQSSRKNQ